jgi:hypothetical protein
MRIPRHLIDIARVDEINLAGRGGLERGVSLLLPRWRRVNAPLHDYEVAVDGSDLRLEVKKQANLQWFDSGKYHRLDAAERDIRIMFLLHDNGRIDVIAITLLGEFLDWLFGHCESDGWNEEVLRIAADFKARYPSLQFKAPAHIATILGEAPKLFDVVYRRSIT